MYQCPNCGGELKYNIAGKNIKCASCSSEFDPYEVKQDNDAEEDNFYEVTVYKCPQCGGEITTTDNTVADFCNFCGASVIMSSKLDKQKCPDYIIPFSKTKEDCKEAYKKFTGRSLFTPAEFKDAKFIDGFRGIYMPYWSYYITQEGDATFSISNEYRKGNYIYTDYYNLKVNNDSYYRGISYDASSSFSDAISESIAPYDIHEAKPFTPSYMLGFYGDTADVKSEVYQDSAKAIAIDQTMDYIKDTTKTTTYKYSESLSANGKKLNTNIEKVDAALFPVWFMSYRKNGRVAYATVNGQTGKVFADMPVSVGKFILGSFVFAIPVFLLLNMFFTVQPKCSLLTVLVAGLMTMFFYNMELTQIVAKDNGSDDLGLLSAKDRPDKAKEINKLKAAKEKEAASGGGGMGVVGTAIVAIILIVLLGAVIVPMVARILLEEGDFTLFLVSLGLFIIGVITFVVGINSLKNIAIRSSVPGTIWALISIFIGMVIFFINPVSDIFYYGAVIVTIIGVFFSLVSLIRYYNILATRKLPQFDLYEGGDDRA